MEIPKSVVLFFIYMTTRLLTQKVKRAESLEINNFLKFCFPAPF
jgi:hypothetical protein